MDKLAANTVRTVLIFVKLLTKFRLVSRRYMFLFLELMFSVSKCASWTIRAKLILNPTLAEFSLDLQLIVPRHDPSIAFESKWIFGHSGLIKL